MKAVQQMSRYARVFISSESPLPEELVRYKLPTSPELIGHVLAHATLVFGESATMVSEAAMLGVPGIYMDSTGRYYTRDIQQKYGLCWCYTESEEDQVAAIAKGVELLASDAQQLATAMHKASKKLLNDKIDVTGFLVWLVENYPNSIGFAGKADEAFWRRFR